MTAPAATSQSSPDPSPPPGTKVCRKCGEAKPLLAFAGRQNTCIACREAAKARTLERKDSVAWSPELGERITDMTAAGMTIAEVCAQAAMPTPRQLKAWRRSNPEFDAAMEAAELQSAAVHLDAAKEVLRQVEDGKLPASDGRFLFDGHIKLAGRAESQALRRQRHDHRHHIRRARRSSTWGAPSRRCSTRRPMPRCRRLSPSTSRRSRCRGGHCNEPAARAARPCRPPPRPDAGAAGGGHLQDGAIAGACDHGCDPRPAAAEGHHRLDGHAHREAGRGRHAPRRPMPPHPPGGRITQRQNLGHRPEVGTACADGDVPAGGAALPVQLAARLASSATRCRR